MSVCSRLTIPNCNFTVVQNSKLKLQEKMTKTVLRQPSFLWHLKRGAKTTQNLLGGFVKGPTSGMRTNMVMNEKPVIFIHNPRTGGRSLECFFGVKRLSHRFPSEKLAEKHWLSHYVISTVRHPFDRFISFYLGFVKSKKKNSLTKKHGEGIFELCPFEFWDLVKPMDRFSCMQQNWTNFPSSEKPEADLILRFEEISAWTTLLEQAGFSLLCKNLPHVGKSVSGKQSNLESLNMTDSEIIILRTKVEKHFASDFAYFGYKFGTFS
jgi:hypothetical protein